MKQIIITTYDKGEVEIEEIFYVEHMDSFIKETIDELIRERMVLNSLYGHHNISYGVNILDVHISDNYELYKYLKEKVDYTRGNIQKKKNSNEKLVRRIKKWF